MMSRPGATGMSPSYGFSPGPINILMPQRNRAWQTCFEKPTPECLPSTHPSICRYTHERLLWRNATCWLNGDVGREAAGAIRQVPAEERTRCAKAASPFRYKDYRRDGAERYRTMTLATDEFIRRFMLHVLPKGFHRIRHCGLLASAGRKPNVARARALLAVPQVEDAAEPVESTEPRPPCPCCGGCMIIIETF